jgi:hypothetical protein
MKLIKKYDSSFSECFISGPLPAISQGQQQHYNLEQIFRAPETKVSSRMSDSAVTMVRITTLLFLILITQNQGTPLPNLKCSCKMLITSTIRLISTGSH